MVKRKKFDEVKNIAAQVLKYNSKNWMKNSDVLYLTSRSIEQCRTEHKNYQKKFETKRIKTEQKHTHCWNSEAFKPKANFFSYKNTSGEKSLKSTFVSEIGPVFHMRDLKNIHWPLKID